MDNEHEQAVAKANSDREQIVKVHFVRKNEGSQALPVEERNTSFDLSGAMVPPHNPDTLCMLLEHSNALRQNVDAYQTNIDGFGYKLEPVLDTMAEDADERIANALLVDRIAQGKDAKMPTDAEVAAAKTKLERAMLLEKARLNSFFSFCCSDTSFITHRRRTRQDLEVTGNSYWEVIRDKGGTLAQFAFIPSYTMRLLPLRKKDQISVKQVIRVSDLSLETVERPKQFRRFVQIVNGGKVFFKEFGDPRIVSRLTGEVFDSPEELIKTEDPDNQGLTGQATEIIHFKIHSPKSAYGVPRWIGALLAVLGNRQAEEVNFMYFENKSVPPLAVLVSGGRMTDEAVTRVQDFVDNEIKGKKNFHKILFLEADSSATPNSGQAKIEIKPLTQAQQSDALFQNYDERNIDKVGQSFRLPRMLRGDIRDFNRSCYSEDTETLTETGWKKWFEIGPDEKIAAFDPDSGVMEFVVPAGKHTYPVENEKMYRFANKHTDCLVTGEHKMLIQSGQTRALAPPWETFDSDKIPYNRFNVRVAPDAYAHGDELPGFDLPKICTCTIERGHKHANTIALSDWLEFIGYFVSEGGIVNTDHPAADYLVYIDQKKPEIREKMRACFDRIGWQYSTQEKSCGTTHFLWSNKCLRDWLHSNVGTNSHNRRIPNEYLALPIKHLRTLFSALMDGDGSVDPRKNRTAKTYYSASSELIGQVQRIALQLGLRATIGSGSGVYRLMMSKHRTTRMHATGQARTPATVTTEQYTGMVYCFSVPTHGFFVTRRNGKIAIQGNTAEAALLFAEMQVFQPEREEFDWTMTRKILTDLDIRFWTFQSLGPISKDPGRLSDMIRGMVRDGIILPGEARNLAEDVFNKPFPQIDEFWANQPLVMTASGFIPEEAFDRAEPRVPNGSESPDGKKEESASDDKKASDTTVADLKEGGKKKTKSPRKFRRMPPIEKDGLFDDAKKLIKLRSAMHEAELEMADDEFMGAKADIDQHTTED